MDSSPDSSGLISGRARWGKLGCFFKPQITPGNAIGYAEAGRFHRKYKNRRCKPCPTNN